MEKRYDGSLFPISVRVVNKEEPEREQWLELPTTQQALIVVGIPLMENILGQILIVLDIRRNIVAIRIFCQVDKILDGVTMSVRIHNDLIGAKFRIRQGFQGSRQIV